MFGPRIGPPFARVESGKNGPFSLLNIYYVFFHWCSLVRSNSSRWFPWQDHERVKKSLGKIMSSCVNLSCSSASLQAGAIFDMILSFERR